MKLIVGLGNPGKEYENTHHNIGFLALDYYLKNINWQKDKLAYTYKTKQKDETVLFVKPTTYMNLSGQAVSHYINYYKIDINDILVIQDDLDLELGKIRIKTNSSSGGHNGIKDIINHLNTQNFLRLKIGISKPNDNVIDYVLSKFSKSEMEKLKNSFKTSNLIIEEFIKNNDIESLMNKYNR